MTITDRLSVRTESVIKAGALAGLVAAAANLAVFLVARVAGVDLSVTTGSSTTDIIFLQPPVSSFLAVFLGSLLLHFLSRSRSGPTIWTVVALVVFVAYTAFAIAASANTGTAIVLTLMHVIALVITFAIVLPVARRRAAG